MEAKKPKKQKTKKTLRVLCSPRINLTLYIPIRNNRPFLTMAKMTKASLGKPANLLQ